MVILFVQSNIKKKTELKTRTESRAIDENNIVHWLGETFGIFLRLAAEWRQIVFLHDIIEKKEDISLSPMTKAPTPTEKAKKQRDNTQTPPKNFDYTTTAGRLRTVSWVNNSHPTMTS